MVCTFHPADPGRDRAEHAGHETRSRRRPRSTRSIGTETMVADPRTGWVYTALGCNEQFRVSQRGRLITTRLVFAVGKTRPEQSTRRTSASFDTVDYKTVATTPNATSLFPVLSMGLRGGRSTRCGRRVDADASVNDALPSTSVAHLLRVLERNTADHRAQRRGHRRSAWIAIPARACSAGWSPAIPGHLGFVVARIRRRASTPRQAERPEGLASGDGDDHERDRSVAAVQPSDRRRWTQPHR